MKKKEEVKDDTETEKGDEGVEGGHITGSDTSTGPGADVVEAGHDEAEVVVVDRTPRSKGAGLIIPSPGLVWGLGMAAEDAGVAAGRQSQGDYQSDDGEEPYDNDEPVTSGQ